MSDGHGHHGELIDLIGGMREGTLDARGCAELTARLAQPAVRRIYVDHMLTCAALASMPWDGLNGRTTGAADVEDDAAAPALTDRRRIGRWTAIAASIAVAIGAALIVAAIVGSRNGERTAAAAIEVAHLINAVDAVWADDEGLARQVGGRLTRGRMRLESGVAELLFDSGAVVTVRGPTVIELVDRNRARVEVGVMTAYVPQRARGFTVTSPGVTVEDLGTEFGMRVEATGEAQVHVFDGTVRVAAGGATQLITAGEALARDADGRLGAIAMDRRSFASLDARVLEQRPSVDSTPMIIDLDSETTIRNDGRLISASNFGEDAADVSANGVRFTGKPAAPEGWHNGRGDFSRHLFEADSPMDRLLSGLAYTRGSTEGELVLHGLTAGRAYRLQLLVADDRYARRFRVGLLKRVAVVAIADGRPRLVVMRFIAPNESVVVDFADEENDTILNAYALHESGEAADDPTGPPPTAHDAKGPQHKPASAEDGESP